MPAPRDPRDPPPHPVPRKPPRRNSDGDGVREKRPRGEKQPLPGRDEIRKLIADLHAELASDDKKAVRQAERLCRQLAPSAAERLGLIITGLQAGTVPQVAMSSISVLKGAGVIDKPDVGGTREATE